MAMARSPRRPSLRDRFRSLKKRWRKEPERVGDGPYRSAPARRDVRRRRWTYALVALVLGAPVLLMIVAGGDEEPPEAAGLETLPPVLVGHVGVFPPVEAALGPATPLDPLLAADGPERLTLRQPSMGATRLQRSQPLHVVFNRPMVEATAVGPVVDDSPVELRFRSGGIVPGTARWSSRSRLIFHADGSAWNGVREATLRVDPEFTAVDGEAFGEQPERTLVFDGTPHLLASGGQRVGAGAPSRTWVEWVDPSGQPTGGEAPAGADTSGGAAPSGESGGIERAPIPEDYEEHVRTYFGGDR